MTDQERTAEKFFLQRNADGTPKYWCAPVDVVKAMNDFAAQQCAEKDKEIERLKELNKELVDALETIDYKIWSCVYFTDKDIQDIIKPLVSKAKQVMK